jgi:CspA family cold shock protein
MPPTKMTGTVKFFDADRGFGFIVPDAGRIDLFVHITSFPDGIDYLTEGQRLRFEEQPSRRKAGKFEAVAVEVI